jgi:hypothetical protein
MPSDRTRRSVITIVVLSSAIGVPALPAFADTLTYQAVIPTQYTNWNQLAMVPHFDPGLGTLDFVVLRLTTTYQASILAENRAPTPGNITASLVSTVVLTPPASLSTMSTGAGIPSITQPVAAYDGVPLTGPDTAIWNLGPTQVSAEQSFSGSTLSSFVGFGPLQFALAGTAQSWVSSDTGNVLALVTSQSDAHVDVEYHYFVPEPATIILLLCGLAGVRRGRPS